MNLPQLTDALLASGYEGAVFGTNLQGEQVLGIDTVADIEDLPDGAIDLETAILEAVIATRQFSKRQRSWFRGRMADWRWLSPGTDDLLAAVPPDRPLAQ